jgi:hypothetical protein
MNERQISREIIFALEFNFAQHDARVLFDSHRNRKLAATEEKRPRAFQKFMRICGV